MVALHTEPTESTVVYVPQDRMYVWWLADIDAPSLIGEVSLVDRGRRVSFKYDASWLNNDLSSGFALSEDLPLFGDEFFPKDTDTAAGAIDDARPDRWGERVIRLFEKPSRLSLMEFLYFAGGDRYGALGISTSRSEYLPCPSTSTLSPMPVFDNLPAMAQVVSKVLAGEPVPELEKRLIRPGASLGGARPKSLIELDGEAWIVKFSEGEHVDVPLLEHAAMTFAKLCGINSAETKALPIGTTGHAVAVRRFDRTGLKRHHVLSAKVVLTAANEDFGYPELAQVLRRLGQPKTLKAQQEELFRRMVFNILIDNTDDHEKNHALIRDAQGFYALAPAFDVLPTLQGLRYQQMRVGALGAESSLENALSESIQFGLSSKEARQIVRDISTIVSGWRVFFAAQGLAAAHLDEIERFIDGDFLRSQRDLFAKA